MQMKHSCRLLATALIVAGCSNHTPSSPSPTRAFIITAADATAPAGYSGSCPVTLSFTATLKGHVTTSGSYQYTYQWEGMDGTKSGPRTDGIAIDVPKPGSFEIPDRRFDLTVGANTNGWMRLHVTDPDDVLSSEVPFSVACK